MLENVPTMWLCTLLLWLELAPPGSHPLSAPMLYEAARQAVVRIEVADARRHTSSASGVVIDPAGVIATNYHVIENGVSARIRLASGKAFDDVLVLATDQRRDIAILKVPARALPFLVFAEPETPRVGSTVYALGAPKGLDGTLSQGLVSGFRDGAEVGPDFEGMNVIQFTAPISPGSSGGPVLDETGRVLGLVCGYKRGGQNLNLAVPGGYVSELLRTRQGEPRRLTHMPTTERTTGTRPASELLAKASTLSVNVSPGSPVLRAEIVRRLLEWGRFQLIASAEDADLVLQISEGAQRSHDLGAWLRDTDSGAELWAGTAGGRFTFSRSHAARAIADQVIRFVDRN
jgi:S1-C subfamily serine protease